MASESEDGTARPWWPTRRPAGPRHATKRRGRRDPTRRRRGLVAVQHGCKGDLHACRAGWVRLGANNTGVKKFCTDVKMGRPDWSCSRPTGRVRRVLFRGHARFGFSEVALSKEQLVFSGL